MIAVLVMPEFLASGAGPERRPWVARILARHEKRGYEREFVDSSADYQDADKKGRGVRRCFQLESGHLYEVCRWVTRHRESRYFVRVDSAGELQGVSQVRVDAIMEEVRCFRDREIRRLLAELECPGAPTP